MAPAAIEALRKAEFVVASRPWRCWAPEYAHVIPAHRPLGGDGGHLRELWKAACSRSTRSRCREGEARRVEGAARAGHDARPSRLRGRGHRPGPRRRSPRISRRGRRPGFNELAPLRLHRGRARHGLERVPSGHLRHRPCRCAARRACRGTADAKMAAKARMNAATAIANGLALRRPRARRAGRRRGSAGGRDRPGAARRLRAHRARHRRDGLAGREGDLALARARRGGRGMTELAATMQGALQGLVRPGVRARTRGRSPESLAGIVAVPRAAAAHGALLPAGRAVGDRLDPGAQGPQPRGLEGACCSPSRTRIKLLMKERIVPAGASKGPLLPRAHRRRRARHSPYGRWCPSRRAG